MRDQPPEIGVGPDVNVFAVKRPYGFLRTFPRFSNNVERNREALLVGVLKFVGISC